MYSDSEGRFHLFDVVKQKGSVGEYGIVTGVRRAFKSYPDQFNVLWLRFPNIEGWEHDFNLEPTETNAKEMILARLEGKEWQTK